MPLKSRNTSPPGGFPYDQKRADGTIIRLGGVNWGFNHTVDIIREYRLGNNLLPTDRASIGAELDAFTSERLGFDPQWVESKKNPMWPHLQQSPSHVIVKAVRHAVTGSQILRDWLGDGGVPIAAEFAQMRADACLKDNDLDEEGKPCPCRQNREGHFAAKLTTLIAKAIHDQRREKLQLGLRVDGEERLHTCAVCDCHLPLKVWVPFQTIADRTPEHQWQEFPAWCWQRKEHDAQKT